MSAPVIAASLWVLAGAGIAFLPLRCQYLPGGLLLLSAPGLLVWLGAVYGIWIALAALLAVLSMFRRPLGHLARRAWGRQ
ncbi:DUF2484 family protein [Antarcticimicrobium luteum]|uniref:DUF2484 family protein n=1 Tax=Antarcticimicrobium luteum TaxID=2547397 RepID=A0A4R5UVE8_9RHOB|nr:DUF2484 family protein [Antarcticimicrobium luteum]TDK43214.1 DUF2484 family protein [Antarcticimicrobium luteum]